MRYKFILRVIIKWQPVSFLASQSHSDNKTAGSYCTHPFSLVGAMLAGSSLNAKLTSC